MHCNNGLVQSKPGYYYYNNYNNKAITIGSMNSSPSSQPAQTNTQPSAAESAAAEKRAARTMSLGKAVYPLATAVLAYVAYLILPHAGAARGYEVLLGTSDITTTIEQVYAVLLTVGIGIATTIVLVTRYAPAGLVGWMCVTVALPYSLFSLWVRHTGPHDGASAPNSIGMYIGMVGVVCAFAAYCSVALKRNPQQQAAADRRADSTTVDDIAQLQRESGMEIQHTDYDSNPLFVDDRRRRAGSRTQRKAQ